MRIKTINTSKGFEMKKRIPTRVIAIETFAVHSYIYKYIGTCNYIIIITILPFEIVVIDLGDYLKILKCNLYEYHEFFGFIKMCTI